MDQVHVIRHKVLVEGQSIRRVAREMGVSRNTVKKYLRESEPRRKAGKAKPRPVMEKVSPRLEELMEEWRGRTTRKQRITAARLHRQLREEGFEVGATTVQDFLREWKRKRMETYVPLVHRPGESAQVDFFEVTVDVDGVRRKVHMFVMRMMNSGRDFAWLYERCDQLSFLDGHVRAFAHFGAVPQRLVYDNLKPAVLRIVYPGRELTTRFRALCSHYLFEPSFARPGEGHDKGGVEARGKGIRLQHLTPLPQGDSLQAIAAKLLADLDAQAADKRDREGRTVLERFADEVPMMLPLPEQPYEARKVTLGSVTSRCSVRLEGATYSVPSHWRRLEATAYVGVEDVRLVCRGEEVVHDRKYFGDKSIRYRHYLPDLAKKPQAVRQVAPELLAELGEPFGALWRLLVDTHGPRDAARVFARVLGAVVDHGEHVVADAVRRGLAADRIDLLMLEPTGKPPQVDVPAALAGYEVEAASATEYDSLLGGDA